MSNPNSPNQSRPGFPNFQQLPRTISGYTRQPGETDGQLRQRMKMMNFAANYGARGYEVFEIDGKPVPGNMYALIAASRIGWCPCCLRIHPYATEWSKPAKCKDGHLLEPWPEAQVILELFKDDPVGRLPALLEMDQARRAGEFGR